MSDPVTVPITVAVVPKPWWESKTVWYNGLKGFLGFVTAVALFIEAAAHSGTLPFYVDEKLLLFGIPFLLMIDAYFGVQLRTVTNAPITGSKP